MKKHHSSGVSLIVFVVVICISVFLDVLTKSIAVRELGDSAVQPFIPGVLDFMLVYNTGAAWGIFDGARVVFVIIAIIVVVAMVVYLALVKRHAALEVIGIGLIAGGAIGNGIDRALSGRVVDFIHTLFIDFPLFNIADSSITVGVILFLLVMFFGKEKTATAETKSIVSEAKSVSEDNNDDQL